METVEVYQDGVLGFTLPHRNVRGRCVRLGAVVDRILSAHDYQPAIRSLLTEALVLCSLMGSLLKGDGQLTMQAQSAQGVVKLLVADYRNGELRGYVDADRGPLDSLGANPHLPSLFGEDAYLAITFDLASSGERYQGIVPLDGDSLSEACESYFRQSEQIPTLIRIAVQSDGSESTAAGLLIQHLPHGEEGRERLHVRYDDPDWEHVEVLASSVRHSELVATDISLETIIWRLFHEEPEIRVEQVNALSRGCRCSVDHFVDVLRKFPEDQRDEMRESDGLVHVDCAFCSKVFEVNV
ncbi:Hsp33 family molecular chaperone HslO [Croceicoccus bisphenolivorans]|uniref:Hsp33 family molecular chaperone HslO n=1 Tax=Croceicoccus bisphenolivorans TaxID=1783232 RepID=UPI00082C7388|nr:Hsp33 family molecular chaperone HslO [Croceicoccus bisphenolivorans]